LSNTELTKDANKDSATAASTSSKPCEELHNLVHLTVAPFRDAYVNSKNWSKNMSNGGTKELERTAFATLGAVKMFPVVPASVVLRLAC
jgi:hypothetical protein